MCVNSSSSNMGVVYLNNSAFVLLETSRILIHSNIECSRNVINTSLNSIPDLSQHCQLFVEIGKKRVVVLSPWSLAINYHAYVLRNS